MRSENGEALAAVSLINVEFLHVIDISKDYRVRVQGRESLSNLEQEPRLEKANSTGPTYFKQSNLLIKRRYIGDLGGLSESVSNSLTLD